MTDGDLPDQISRIEADIEKLAQTARALTNLIGNGVATIVVSKWENALDEQRMREHLNRETDLEADAPEKVMPA